ncbi:MAG: hypothetical protein HYT03_01360 [Candidatus Harrisonbacteria bacterium]|nr:hypothetical protein [Candidatus Harrisonbacteria bacterium]
MNDDMDLPVYVGNQESCVYCGKKFLINEVIVACMKETRTSSDLEERIFCYFSPDDSDECCSVQYCNINNDYFTRFRIMCFHGNT